MESISTTLFSLYRGTPFHNEWTIACLRSGWQAMFGESVANVCRPVAVRRGELVVEVLDEAWLPALAGMKQDMLQQICAAAGGEFRQLALVLKQTG